MYLILFLKLDSKSSKTFQFKFKFSAFCHNKKLFSFGYFEFIRVIISVELLSKTRNLYLDLRRQIQQHHSIREVT